MKSKSTYKELKKYMDKLLDESSSYFFNNTTLNIYSLSYYLSILIAFERLIEALISSNPLVDVITAICLFITSYIIKKEGFKKVPYIFLINFILIVIYYYVKNNIILLPIIIVFISYPLIILFKYLKIKSLSYFYLYEENGFKGCNLLLKEVTPIENYDNLIKINIKIEENLDGKELKKFNDNLMLFCDKYEYLFMGFLYDKNKLNYEAYIYTFNYDINSIKKFLNNNINYKYNIIEEKDKNYDFYYDSIIPSDKLFLHMCNKNIIDNKLPKEINLNDEQNLILILSFISKDNAMECKKELENTHEYKNVKYEDNSKYVKENKINEIYNHILYIEKESRIGLSKINLITDIMYDYAVKFDGSFEEWGIGVLED